MRVTCPYCDNKSIISSSNILSSKVKDLYCTCTNKECSSSFVVTLAFKHVLSPPITTINEMALNMVNNMSLEEKKAFKQKLMA